MTTKKRTWASECPGFYDWRPVALENGINGKTYYSRVRDLGYTPKEAATTPLQKGPQPNSINTRCKKEGIHRRRFCAVQEELRDGGHDPSPDEVIAEIKRRRKA